MRDTALKTLLLLQAARFSYINAASTNTSLTLETQEYPISPTALQSESRGMDEDHHDLEPKSKPWSNYYDFLITEGSYKFWVVFELFTCALLIYSAFTAIYYAKYTITEGTDYDYDYFFKRRSLRSAQQQQSTFLGLSPQTYLRIFEAISDFNRKYS